MSNWDEFNERTKDNPPRELYLEAIQLVPEHAQCIDIAAGALVDTKDMLTRGHHVLAVDSNSSVVQLADAIDSDRLQAVVAGMEGFDYGVARFDYANAMFALPFIAPKHFNTTFQRITTSLNPGGIFAFHLFGHEDDWYNNPKVTFHTMTEVEELTANLTVMKLKEVQDSMALGDGSMKQWHIFQVILKK